MESVNSSKSEHGLHRLGWCDPGQARFWNLEEPSHRCPGKLGHIVCACPHHDGMDPEKVNVRDRMNRAKVQRSLREKNKRRVVRKKA